MLTEIRRRSEVTRLSLDGLDANGVAELVAAAAGHELDDSGQQLAHVLQAETSGNPFFVSEVLRHLAETGAIERRDGAWVASGEPFVLPEGVRDVVGRRVSALPDDAQRLLATAAVIGPTFDLELLAEVAGIDADAALDAVEPAATASLVQEEGVGAYEFAHALVRSTLHQELSTTRRSRLHRRVAEALEARHAGDLDAVAADLAYHWSEAHASDVPERARVYARRAGELAVAALAFDESARWYERAIELLDGADPATEAELTVRRGLALDLAGSPDADAVLLHGAALAAELADPRLMAEALAARRRKSIVLGQRASPEKIRLLERALELVADDDSNTRGALLAELVVELAVSGDDERRWQVGIELQALRSRVDDLATRIAVNQSAVAALPAGFTGSAVPFHELIADSAVILVDTRASGDVYLRTRSLMNHFFGSLVVGDGASARSVTAELRELAVESRHPECERTLPVLDVVEALIAGDLERATHEADVIEQLWTAQSLPDAEIYVASVRAQVLRERGFLAMAADMVLSGLSELDRHVPTPRLAVAALALTETDRTDETFALVAAAAKNDFTDIPNDFGAPVAFGLWADVVARVGHAEGCEALLDAMVEGDVHLATGAWYLGAVAHYRGLLTSTLGRRQEAEACFEHAVAAHEAMASPPWIARALVEWGVRERDAGRSDHAAALARRAIDAIGDLGLDESRARAESLLSLGRLRASRRSPSLAGTSSRGAWRSALARPAPQPPRGSPHRRPRARSG
jgi:tetratricopeptide (TPR) repeat protein